MTQEQEKTILQWLDIFAERDPSAPGMLSNAIEIRVLQNGKTESGYFKNVESILKVLKQKDGNGGMIYAPFNTFKPGCYAREQRERMVQKPQTTTSDNDIIRRNFILIDLDPCRPAGVNATDEEKKKALVVARKIYSFLVDQSGLERPIVADSGNGFHLYFRVNLANGESEKKLVKDFLNELGVLFSTDDVEVDCSVFNAARISKIIGTTSCKGTNTAERPARISHFLNVPDEIKTTDEAYIRKIAEMLPQAEQPSKENNFVSGKFDMEQFIQEHSIEVKKRIQIADGTRYVLEECPFDSNHKDSALFVSNSGAIGFHCFHNSCSNYGWKDFRLYYDPGAYSRQTWEANSNWRRFKNQHPPKMILPDNYSGPAWLSPKEIIRQPIPPSIPTGYTRIDKKIRGLLLGEVSVLSGTNGSGKSSWINNLIANAIQSGFKCAVWSGELQNWKFMEWISQVLAGKNRVRKKEGFEFSYYVPGKIFEKITAWLDGKLWLYHEANRYEWPKLSQDIEKLVDEKGVKLVVLDNLAVLNLDSPDNNPFQQQSSFMAELTTFAKRKQIHILLVCHPRKEVSFLRKESISGSGDLTNLVDNVFIIHRIGTDFRKRAAEFLGGTITDKIMDEYKYNNVLEVCKNRFFGVVDLLVGMYFEIETRRMKNAVDECILYGWDEQPQQQAIEPPIDEQPLPYSTEVEEEEIESAQEFWYNKD